jgi:hypothetical protein
VNDPHLAASRELGRAGPFASLGIRPAAGANSAALSFWEPASSLLVCPDDAYAVNADLKQVCLQKALAIKALEEIVFRPEQPLLR